MKAWIIVLVPAVAHAGGTEVGDQNAVSAATGGAGVARDGDPGAAWHDPAALADGGGWRVGFSLALARPSLSAQMPDGTQTSNDGAWQTPPHLDASFASGRWAAGISLGVPFGGGVTWPTAWPGQFEAVETQLQVFRAAPFAAWSFGDLRVAAGFHVDAGRLQITRGLDFIDTTGNVRIDMDGRGIGVDASAYWRASDAIGVGLVYRGRSTLSLGGPANFTTPDAFSEKTPDQMASSTLTLPDQVVLGARWREGAIAILADAAWTHWSVNQATVVAFADPQTPSAVQTNAWHDTIALRAGGEWQRDALTVRAGAYYDPTPVPADHLAPTAPDGTRLGVTAGAGYRLSGTWTVDAFAERMWILRRDATSPDTMAASYGGSALVLGAGLRWH
jgi:long-chain fatty acid transport protein